MNNPMYCLPVVEKMYYHYLQMFQERYTQQQPFTVTWKHISFWRKHVTLYGTQLIEAGLLSRELYLQQKNTIVHGKSSACLHTVKTQITL